MSKQKRLLLAASLALLSGLAIAAAPAQAIPLDQGVVRFKVPTKLDLALSAARSQGLRVEYIEREHKIGSQSHVNIVNVGDKDQLSTTAITSEYWKAYEATLQDLLSQPGTPDPKEDPRIRADRIAQHRDLEQERQKLLPYKGCWKNNTCPEVSIIQMQVTGETTAIAKLQESPQVDSVVIRSVVMRSQVEQGVPPQECAK